jgi:hypothetical protein
MTGSVCFLRRTYVHTEASYLGSCVSVLLCLLPFQTRNNRIRKLIMSCCYCLHVNRLFLLEANLHSTECLLSYDVCVMPVNFVVAMHQQLVADVPLNSFEVVHQQLVPHFRLCVLRQQSLNSHISCM